ncbi:EF-hand calcium-binding domain-containing protein 6-like [Stegodyphus dumicola]|uniref:EF-hand calcium-binding domain-containing protein 6-like n=1 Tax=Stegodyphus dumicola TaxID=202533 RepID=UPI0015AF4752|nr:EF-hand calcium-binding domain-containing protein 6-like [Stegodyphus dumicola]
MASCISRESNDRADAADDTYNFETRPASPPLSKIASSASVSSIASFPEYDLKANLQPEVIKNRLSDIIKSKGPDLIQACKNFDRRSTRKIPKSQLRQVLRTFCFPITAAQFDLLCEEVNVDSYGKLNYYDFLTKISGLKNICDTRISEKLPEQISVDEIELRIKEKISSRLRDVICAFWLFDINKDGFIQKNELRRIIRNYCFEFSDDLYNELWKCYDPKATGVIRYRDFLVKLGVNADRYRKYMPPETVAHAMCWTDKKSKNLMDDIKFEQRTRRAAVENRDDPIIQGLPLEEVLSVFLDRLQRQAKVLKNAFPLFDYENTGEISLSDFRRIINFFVMPMSSNLFNRIIKRLDIQIPASKKLRYQEFLENFCSKSACDKKCGERSLLKLDCYPVVQRIKNRVVNPDSRLRSVFTKINPDKVWQITRPELKHAIEIGLDFKLSDDDFKELMTLLDPGNTNVINCMDFLRLFDETSDRNFVREDNLSDFHELPNVEKYQHLCGKKLKSKLKHHLNKNIINIERAFLVCDCDQSGFILPERLKDILSNFCFPLSDEQFEDLVAGLKKYGDSLNYKEFLKLYKKKSNEDADKWVAIVEKLVTYKSRCPPELPIDEVEELLRDCVCARKSAMLKDFKTLDVCNVGVACKDDAKHVLNKYAFRFSDKQFHEIWKRFPVNKYDQLLYDEFLEKYSAKSDKLVSSSNKSVQYKTGEKVEDEKDTEERDKKEASKTTCVTRKAPEIRKSAKVILYSKAPHLKHIFDAMESAIIRNFRKIRFHLHRADPKVTGTVDFTVLKNILAKSGIYFTKEEEFHILEYFDVHLKGKINYRDFLRIFVWYA